MPLDADPDNATDAATDGDATTDDGTAVDATAELRAARFRPPHVLLAVAVMVANVFDGYDTLNPSYVISYTEGPWHLTHSAAGFLVSSGLIGFMVGALGHGPLADRIGRKPVLLGALTGAGLLSLLTAVLARDYASFVLLRLLTGVFLGSIMPVGTAYIREFAPQRSAGRLVVATTSGYCLGGVLSAFVGIYVTPAYGWHSLYWIGGGSLVLGLALIPLLPESAAFLVLRGRDRDARTVLARLRPERSGVYEDARFLRPGSRVKPGEAVRELVGPRLRRPTCTLWIGAFMLLFCIYGLSGWLPSVMQDRGNSFAASFACLAILQCAGIVGGFVVGGLTDRTSSATGMARGMAVLMLLATASTVAVGLGAGKVLDLVFIGVAGFGVIGAQNVINALAADTYPARVRSTGTGTMFGVGRIGAILGPYLIGWLLDLSGGRPGVVFAAIATATACGSAAGVLLARDRGRPPSPDPSATAAAPEKERNP